MTEAIRQALAPVYKAGILEGIRGGTLSRQEATFVYLEPFAESGVFEAADIAEIGAALDEKYGNVEG